MDQASAERLAFWVGVSVSELGLSVEHFDVRVPGAPLDGHARYEVGLAEVVLAPELIDEALTGDLRLAWNLTCAVASLHAVRAGLGHTPAASFLMNLVASWAAYGIWVVEHEFPSDEIAREPMPADAPLEAVGSMAGLAAAGDPDCALAFVEWVGAVPGPDRGFAAEIVSALSELERFEDAIALVHALVKAERDDVSEGGEDTCPSGLDG